MSTDITRVGSVISELANQAIVTVSIDRDGLVLLGVKTEGNNVLLAAATIAHLSPQLARSIAKMLLAASGIN